MHKRFLSAAALLGALSVILGAFGAHALKKMVGEAPLAIYETAVRYQFYHVFALALAGVLYREFPSKLIKAAGQLFITGIIFFSGSLYLLTYAAAANLDFRWAGPITPIGGLFLIAGWVCLFLGTRKGRH